MRALGFLLVAAGVITGGVGLWRKNNPSGPVFFGGQVNDSIRELFGSSVPGVKTLWAGAVLLSAGIVVVLAAP